MLYTHSFNIRKDQLMTQKIRNSPSILWYFWLLITIAAVGAPGCLVAAPGWIVGYFWYPATIAAGRFGRRAIKFMLMLNPWLKVRVEGEFPSVLGRLNCPAMIVANHRSALDVFLLITMLPNVRIVAKKELWGIPFLGFIMTMMKHIPVDRGDAESLLKLNSEIVSALKRGESVAVFPEGKRCEKGFFGLQRMSLFAFKLARNLNLPVYPLVFSNTDQIWPKGSYKIQGGEAVVYILDPLPATHFQTTKALVTETRERMMSVLAGSHEY